MKTRRTSACSPPAIPSSEITSEAAYLKRRDFLRGVAGFAGGIAVGGCFDRQEGTAVAAAPADPSLRALGPLQGNASIIGLTGSPGVGKSTLVGKLSEKLGWQPYYEPVAENPYLIDFYNDMKTWAFHSQVYFLNHRMAAHFELLNNPSSVVQDRSVYEDAEIFAKNQYIQGNISERDYAPSYVRIPT